MGVEQALYNGRVKGAGGGGKVGNRPVWKGAGNNSIKIWAFFGACRGHATWSSVAGLGSKRRLIRLSIKV